MVPTIDILVPAWKNLFYTKFYQKNHSDSGRKKLGRNLAKFLLYKLVKMKVVTPI
jgi:hypothetical protein